MRLRLYRPLLPLAAAVLLATPAGAQATGPLSDPRGFFATLAFNGTTLNIDEGDDLRADDSGAGLTLGIGYGFGPRFALFLRGTGAQLESDADGTEYNFGHGDLGVRYHFSSATRKLVPYLEAAFTGRVATIEDFVDEGTGAQGDLEIRSTSGLTFGGGVLWFFSPRWAANAGLAWTTGEFDEVEFRNITVGGGEVDGTSTRFNLGVTWFPMAGRAR